MTRRNEPEITTSTTVPVASNNRNLDVSPGNANRDSNEKKNALSPNPDKGKAVAGQRLALLR